MALTAHKSWYTGDAAANTYIQDFSPLVFAPPLPGAEIALWPLIGKMSDGTEPTKYEWIEEQITPNSITINDSGGINTTDTSVVIAAGDLAAAGIRIGTMLKNSTDKTKKEVILVTDITTSTNTLTITRDYGGFVSGSGGGTTGEAHSDADELEIIGYLNPEGSTVVSTDYFAKRNRDPKYNYYSLLDDWTQITASDLVRVYRGSTPDNWGYQLNGIKQRLDRTFERHLWDSPQVARAAGVYGSMGGLRWYATQTTGDQDVTTAESFSYEVFDDGMEYLYNQGTLDGPADIVCLMPPAGIQVAAYIHESAQRSEYVSETVRGLRCTTLMSTITGDRVPLVPCRNMPSDSFMLLNLNALRIHFLQGRALAVYNSAVGEGLQDYQAARLISEMTLEIHRPQDNCYYHTGVTYTRPTA